MSVPARNQPEILQARICNLCKVEGVVLDLGIGQGGWTEFLLKRARRIVGLDVSIENLNDVKRAFPKLELVHGDALHLPFRSNIFDSVFAGYLLHHLPNLETGLSEVQRVLKTGGVFNSIDPNKSHPLFWLGWRARNFNLHPPRFLFGDWSHAGERPLSKQELTCALSKVGFLSFRIRLFSSLPSELTDKYTFLRSADNLLSKVPILCGNIFLSAEKDKARR